MAENKEFDFYDIVLIFLKYWKILIIFAVSLLILSYLFIYFFINEQYKATSLIVPSDAQETGGITSLLKGFSNLPLNLGGIGKNTDVDIYNTIIYSRTNLEDIIDKFNLMEDYGLESREKTIKTLKEKIETEETEEGAFEITAFAGSREKAANMTNYIVDQLNTTVIELDVQKSRDNRVFIERRYNEIQANLRLAEDSLTSFQKQSGILVADEQTLASIKAYAGLEAELAQKQIELEITKKIYGENSPQFEKQEIAVDEFEKKLKKLKSNSTDESAILPIDQLPDKGMEYLRRYRNVEINNAMLEFIIPLYEQARYEEQKTIPVLQIIDRAVPPEKKAYPRRTLASLVITLAAVSLLFFMLIFREYFIKNSDPKIAAIKQSFKRSSNK